MAAAILSLIASTAPVAAQSPLEIFVLAGQSNMSGRAPLSPAPAFANAGHIFAFKRNAWVPAREPVADEPEAELGPSMAFADALFALRRHDIGLLNCAIGGTSIREWRPDEKGGLFAACVERARAATSRGKILGLIWYQGEQDTFSFASATIWPRHFGQTIAGFRKALGAANLPVVFTQIGPTPAAHVAPGTMHKLMQLQAQVRLPYVTMTSAADLSFQDDRLHLDQAGQLALGARYAVAMNALLAP